LLEAIRSADLINKKSDIESQVITKTWEVLMAGDRFKEYRKKGIQLMIDGYT